jgi:general secretion pathway protein G
MPQRIKTGFTLIEVMVVVAIIGVLLALSAAGLQGARASSRDAQRKSQLEDIRSALEIYRSDCGSYPAASGAHGLAFGTGTLVGTGVGNCSSSNVYMSAIPQDPQSVSKGLSYEYVTSGSNTSYSLCAITEHGSASSTGCGGSGTQKCGTTGCNYTKTNP